MIVDESLLPVRPRRPPRRHVAADRYTWPVAATALTRERWGSVNILELEPSFCAGLAPEPARVARAAATARACVVEPGPWDGDTGAGACSGDLGLLIVGGFLGRRVQVGPQACTELLGAGDLIRPWDVPDALASIPAATSWTVLSTTTVALVDEQLVGRMCAWPPVIAALAKRMMDRSHTLAFHLAVCHLTRVDQRVLVVLWHLADRWGRVTPKGIALTLPLTHELLAHVVGARRPTVTTALAELAGRGLVTRGSGRRLLLHGEPPGELHDLRRQVAG